MNQSTGKIYYPVILLLVLFILTGYVTTGYAQNSNNSVPFWKTYNPRKLSWALTSKLETDSAKVASIHWWITHHIKYNTKKFLSSDLEIESTKKVLRKRKAICTGYADLFNELCKYAGIVSVSVPGYIKNEYTDLGDKFYLDEHVWNAVFLNGRWRLIDVTWDAGYLKYSKLALIGYPVYAFTFGNIELKKFKAHFKKSPNYNYYLKGGEAFYFDHLPADSLWQLSMESMTVNEFEKDSSFYLGQETERETKYDSYRDDFRLQIAGMDTQPRNIHEGFATFSFNERNQAGIGRSQAIVAETMIDALVKNPADSISTLLKCDSIVELLKYSIVYYDTMLSYLEKQNGELTANNHLKHETISKQNAALLKSTYRVQSWLHSGKTMKKPLRKKNRKTHRLNEKRLSRMNKSTAFYKAVFKNDNEAETKQLKEDIKTLQDSIAKFKNNIDSISRNFLLTDNVDARTRFDQYAINTKGNILITKMLATHRMDFYDDLDYDIRIVKDSLMKDKFKSDSLLLDSSEFLMMKGRSIINSIAANISKIGTSRRLIGTKLVRLKRVYSSTDEVMKMYTDNLSDYNSDLNKLLSEFSNKCSMMISLSQTCKKLNRLSGKEARKYRMELRMENEIYPFRTGYLSNHHANLKKFITAGKRRSEKLILKFERIKKGEKLAVVFKNYSK